MIKVPWHTKLHFRTKNRWSYSQGGLKIKGCKAEGPLYSRCGIYAVKGNSYSISPVNAWNARSHLDFSHCGRPICPRITSTTNIGSRCACSGNQSRFGLVFVTHLGQSNACSSGQLSQTNQDTVSHCCHCDGEVVIHSTNGQPNHNS